MPNILTFGDSNTHGTPPIVTRGLYARYDQATRWPMRLARRLGPDWHLVEEGLPGRTAAFADPVMGAHMNGQDGLKIALQSHGPLDLLTIMLGTNDVKSRFGASPERIVAGLASLVDIALGLEMAARHPGLRLLLICPPPVQERGVLAPEFQGGAAKAQALAPMLEAYAAQRGVGFLDAGRVLSTSPTDGVHFEPQGHAALADAVAGALPEP
ncbi:MAG: SGNH/GDSL hydrolase family protein [Pseudorhodobacter sp.]